MCLIKGAFVGKTNFDVIKMHGTTIKNVYWNLSWIIKIKLIFEVCSK
jgi:hypothetical protein